MRSHVMPWKESSAESEQRMFIEMWSRGHVPSSGVRVRHRVDVV